MPMEIMTQERCQDSFMTDPLLVDRLEEPWSRQCWKLDVGRVYP
jgi:hypothetical protein